MSLNTEYIVSEVQMHYGTWMEMRSCAFGVFMYTYALMATHDSSYILSAATTKSPALLKQYLWQELRNMVGQVGA